MLVVPELQQDVLISLQSPSFVETNCTTTLTNPSMTYLLSSTYEIKGCQKALEYFSKPLPLTGSLYLRC